MRQPCEITGELLWEQPGIYRELPDLAVCSGVRAIIADFIGSLAETYDSKLTVFSLGAGRAELYRQNLCTKLRDDKIRLLGIESDGELAGRAAEEFPGKYMVALTFRNVMDGFSSIVTRSITKTFDINENTVDFAEARFFLSSVLMKAELVSIMERVFRLIKPGGSFILAEIDSSIGSYIEKKIMTMRKFFKEMRVDVAQGILVGKKHRSFELPILDRQLLDDAEILRDHEKASLQGLREETEKLGMPGWSDIFELEREDVYSGRKWYRPKEEWEEIIRQGCRTPLSLQVIPSHEIKKLYPDVKDNPFIITAKKL
ncbi:MAG: hypothetical protein RDV48_09825 [Candidatus Eremiobacteraeota bacterium]|nr:hypothetical protein [Candidatus Eremiobacteraeota bacterium]